MSHNASVEDSGGITLIDTCSKHSFCLTITVSEKLSTEY